MSCTNAFILQDLGHAGKIGYSCTKRTLSIVYLKCVKSGRVHEKKPGTLSQLPCAAATHASMYGEQTGSLSCGRGPLMKTDSRGRPLDGAYEGRSMLLYATLDDAVLVRAPEPLSSAYFSVISKISRRLFLQVSRLTDCSVKVLIHVRLQVMGARSSSPLTHETDRRSAVRRMVERVRRRPIFLLLPYISPLCGLDGREKPWLCGHFYIMYIRQIRKLLLIHSRDAHRCHIFM